MFFPTKEAPDHPTNVFDQASEGGLHFGSESGVGAELAKNSAPMASALITWQVKHNKFKKVNSSNMISRTSSAI